MQGPANFAKTLEGFITTRPSQIKAIRKGMGAAQHQQKR